MKIRLKNILPAPTRSLSERRHSSNAPKKNRNYTVELSSSLYAHDAGGGGGSLMTQSMDAAMLGGRLLF